MGLDRTRWPEPLLGLEGMTLLEVTRGEVDRPHVAVQSTDPAASCGGWGTTVVVQDRLSSRLPLVTAP